MWCNRSEIWIKRTELRRGKQWREDQSKEEAHQENTAFSHGREHDLRQSW